MARWEDALDALTDVYKFWHSDIGVRYGKSFLSDREQKLATGVYGEERERLLAEAVDERARSGDQEHEDIARAAALYVLQNEHLDIYTNMDQRFGAMAFNSDPIYVDPEMWSLVLAASESWQGEALERSDLPTDAGFMLLPEQFFISDVWDKQVGIRAINWHPMTFTMLDPETKEITSRVSGILMGFYHRTDDKDDYSQPGERAAAPWLLSHAMPWMFGVNDGSLPKYEGFSLGMALQVCWRLMQQEVAVRDQRLAGGQFRKRAKRAELPEKKVTVVTLRRPRHVKVDEDEPRAVEWSHRWITSGHWRNQPYSTLGISRLIWIGPYVKGPEDKPLVIRKVRAFQFVR